MVVLGYRQSISSTLRNILLDASSDPDQQPRKSRKTNIVTSDSKVSDQYVQNVLTKLLTSNSTAAYLIFCQPSRIYIIEKDHRSANIRESDTFLTAYNHDVKDEEDPSRLQEAVATLAEGDDATGMVDIVGLSLSRKNHLQGHWRKRVSACRRRYKQRSDVVTMSDVIRFLEHDEISNLETHYAVIMDPEEGKVIWRRRYEVESDSSSEDSP
jgi:predicted type IV restriction endonuclease